MTRIKFLQAIAGHGSPDRIQEHNFAFAPDDIALIEPELAAAWCASGIAELAPLPVEKPAEKPKAEFAIKPKAETATVSK